jgi:hypothetical protein
MSNIAAGTTSTTALVATADTTGALVFQTGASATTAMTISSTQTVSFTNLLNYYTASLGADVSLTNTATYFDGPSVAQGTSGTWLVTAHVTVAGNNDNIFAKLWDGTTVVSSTETDGPASGSRVTITLNGIFVNPAGNIKISVRDGTNTTTKIVYNASGNSQDSNITAVRIA